MTLTIDLEGHGHILSPLVNNVGVNIKLDNMTKCDHYLLSENDLVNRIILIYKQILFYHRDRTRNNSNNLMPYFINKLNQSFQMEQLTAKIKTR